MKPAISDHEARRLAALRAHQLLDTPPEAPFDELVRLAALASGCPMALVSLTDADRQWYKACHGVPAREGSRAESLCAHALTGPLILEDALADPRFRDNPYVAAEGGVRFYAGFPLVDAEGYALGTLCVFDPRPWRTAMLPASTVDT